MKQLFKGQISFQAVFSKQAQDSYYHGILAATDIDSPTLDIATFVHWGVFLPPPNLCLTLLLHVTAL